MIFKRLPEHSFPEYETEQVQKYEIFGAINPQIRDLLKI